MATPSVLTVPSMYGDGILYSGPTVFSNELITNGDFATDSDWTKQTGWTIANGKATCDGTNLAQIYQTNVLTHLKRYKVTFSIVSVTSGGVFVKLGADVLGVTRTEIGTYTQTFYFSSSNPSNLTFHLRSSNFVGSIDNVSVKEITQGSDFDFTRATTGTRINEDGYIEDVPYNLVTYSEDFTNWSQTRNTVTANTIIAPDGTLTADKIAANSTFVSNTSRVLQNITATNANTFSVFAKADEITEMLIYGLGSNNGVYFNLTNGSFVNYLSGTTNISSYNIENYNDGWNRFSVTFTTTNTRIEIYLSKNNSYVTDFTIGEGFYLWSAQLVKGDQQKNYLPTTDRVNLPRLNYPVYGGCPSLLLEPQRTNDILNNTNLSQWLIGGGITVTSNAVNSPEGIQNADKIEKTSQSYTYVRQSIATGNVSVFSIFVKQGNYRYVGIRNNDGGGVPHSVFDFETKSFSISQSNHNLSVQEFPNGWFRLIDERTISTDTNNFRGIALTNSTGGEISTDIPVNSFVYVWGGQLENNQTYPTSLIHTSGATVTRNQDVAENAGLGTTDTFNDSEGVLYGELRFDKTSPGNYIGIDDGTTSNRIIIGAEGGNIRVYSPGFTFSVNNLPMFGVNKIAFSWQTNLRKLFINGVKLGENTGAYTGPTGLNQLAFDSGSASQIFDGEAKAVAVYKTALTDTELANLTSYNNHDLFIPYRSRMQMISADQELQCTEHDITRFL